MKPPPGRDYNAWEQTNQDFLAGRTAMIWTSTAFLKYLEENAPFRIVAAPLPRHRRAAVPTGGTHWIVLKGAPEREKQTAWAFLRFMHEPAQAIHWSTQTGYMPVTKASVTELERRGYYAKHPNDRVAYDQLGVALPWPWSSDLFRIQREVVQPRLESAILENRPAKAVMDDARAAVVRGY
jgi:sn-glycerol 3-phosphate transport system substrate-binding protein